MTEHLRESLEAILSFAPASVLWTLVVLMILNSLVQAPSSEYVGIYAGIYASRQSPLYLVLVIVALSLANLAGTYPWYWVGKFRAERSWEFLPDWLTARLPSLLHRLYVKRLPGVLERFEQSEEWLVFGLRFVPIIRSIISYPAGFSRMPLHIFLVYSFVGMTMSIAVWTLLGYLVGATAYTLGEPVAVLIGSLVAILLAGYWIGR